MLFEQKFVKGLKEMYLEQPKDIEFIDAASEAICNSIRNLKSNLEEVEAVTDDLKISYERGKYGTFAQMNFKQSSLRFERENELTISVYVGLDNDEVLADTICPVEKQALSQKYNEKYTVEIFTKYFKEAFKDSIPNAK
jgi:hypothetical protein